MNTGGRFARKAAIPSWASAEATIVEMASVQHITARTFPPLIFKMVPLQNGAVAR
jgi:hypothetical protein